MYSVEADLFSVKKRTKYSIDLNLRAPAEDINYNGFINEMPRTGDANENLRRFEKSTNYTRYSRTQTPQLYHRVFLV